MPLTNKEVVMKLSIVLSVLFYSLSSFGNSLKIEGNCSGTLDDGSKVNIVYYSNFDGCKKVSASAISLGQDLYTGTRQFISDKDVHSVKNSRNKEILALRFANSTGNSSAIFKYIDSKNVARVVPVQCEVRDYSYADCL